MNEDMVERVAQALARRHIKRALAQVIAAHLRRGEPSEEQIEREVEKAWPHHVEDARAAIAAMRFPDRDD